MSDTLEVGEALRRGTLRLRRAGVEAASRDARLLLAEAAGQARTRLTAFPERRLNAGELAAYETFLARRARREPVSRILGRREFWSLDFAVTADTLDPRPETETLVEAVLARLPDRRAHLRVLDLGSGSGCILLALLSELTAARGLGVDRSVAAVEVARGNAEALGLQDRAAFRVGDWAEDLAGTWQAIVSNPPYIVESEIEDLAPEVRVYDPLQALSGGRDGLDAYRVLLPQAARLLAPEGLLALEVGFGQADVVQGLAEAVGLKVQERVRDLAGRERCLIATPFSRG
ncbi:MAG: peptide chain release factor N(5)-glutamine methyltransferase [Kiloniellales bacterium]|nr:peptide chain release factor N(5)-glutamine methyltransferase [Kiloniellales bacterium]